MRYGYAIGLLRLLQEASTQKSLSMKELRTVLAVSPDQCGYLKVEKWILYHFAPLTFPA